MREIIKRLEKWLYSTDATKRALWFLVALLFALVLQLWITLATLATYRLSRMIALEDGPADVFSSTREWVGQLTWTGRGLHCVLCLSFWLSWLVALLLPLATWQEYILASLGIAGGVVVIHKVIG